MSLFIAIIVSSTARILKIPSLVPNPDLNPVCPLLISLSKMASFLSMNILSNNFVTWLIRQMVRYSVHSTAFVFGGILTNTDCFKSFGNTPVL